MRGGPNERRRVRVSAADRGVRGVDFRRRARGRAGSRGEWRHAGAGHDNPHLVVGTGASTAVGFDARCVETEIRDSRCDVEPKGEGDEISSVFRGRFWSGSAQHTCAACTI